MELDNKLDDVMNDFNKKNNNKKITLQLPSLKKPV